MPEDRTDELVGRRLALYAYLEPLLSGRRVLEILAGSGRGTGGPASESAQYLRSLGARVVSVDMDTTTGLRFHFGELALAAWFRAAQILFIGADRETLRAWQQMLFASVVFHHSNVELPIAIERRLVGVLVTPRMHGIHHSTRVAESDTNFSSLLSCWDRLHRSLELNVPQASITIGVLGFTRREDVTLVESLTVPFRGDQRLLLEAAPGSAPGPA